MNIKVSDLRKFKAFSSHMKGTGILPIQDYLKLGNGLIQKDVSSSFIKFQCSDANEELLVDEKILYKLVDMTPSDSISILQKKGKTIISDGRDTIAIQVPEIKLFLDIPTLDLEKEELSADFLDAIGSASQICKLLSGIPDKYMYVMIGNKCVTGIDMSFGYCRLIEETVKMALEKKIAAFVSRNNMKYCSISDSHYVFYTDDVTIGFARQEVGYGDYGATLRTDPGELTFTASNSDIKSFNTLAMSLCEFPQVTMTPKGTLEMYDSLKDISQDRALSIKPYENFTYLPSSMNLVLSALGDEALDFYQKENMLIIKSTETKATAAIGKIQKL